MLTFRSCLLQVELSCADTVDLFEEQLLNASANINKADDKAVPYHHRPEIAIEYEGYTSDTQARDRNGCCYTFILLLYVHVKVWTLVFQQFRSI